MHTLVVAEKDILKERGKLYYKKLVKSGWLGTEEIVETEGEDHVFHIFDPNCDNAKSLFKLSCFFFQPNIINNNNKKMFSHELSCTLITFS